MTFSPYGLGTCRDCRAQVRWATTEKGLQQPLNPEPDPAGNVAGRLGEGPGWWARVPTAERPWHPGERRFMPHAATCPHRVAPRLPQAPSAPAKAPTHQDPPVPIHAVRPLPSGVTSLTTWKDRNA